MNEIVRGVAFNIFMSFTTDDGIIDWACEVTWTGNRMKAGGVVLYEIKGPNRSYWWSGAKIKLVSAVETLEPIEKATL
jgi:hypothetical protein